MSLSIRIPIRKYTSNEKTKKKKGEFVKTLIHQEKCNLCRLKFFANWLQFQNDFFQKDWLTYTVINNPKFTFLHTPRK